MFYFRLSGNLIFAVRMARSASQPLALLPPQSLPQFPPPENSMKTHWSGKN